MARAIVGILLFARLALGGAAGDLARAIGEIALDPEECYRVRDITIVKEDARFYLTDGYLIFGSPIAGKRVSAVFTTGVEGGDGEVLLLPPTRSERRSLASYTGSPNMDEHVDLAVFTFSDDTAANLQQQLGANPFNRKVPEMGHVLAEQFHLTVRNIAASFETRLALDLLSQAPGKGFFTAALHSKRLSNFDVSYDPHALEQMVVGQIVYRENRVYMDIWTSFEARSVRTGKIPRAVREFTLRDYRIEATLDPDLSMHVTTRVKLRPARSGEMVYPFDISRQMRVTGARVDGQAAEILQSESFRSNLIRNNGNDLFLVVMPQALEAGRDYEIEFRNEGQVVRQAGERVFFVGARSNWYPNFAGQYATYDLTFRYPRDLDLVTPGEVAEDKTEGDWRVTRRRTGTAIRFAGFNLGAYQRARVTRAGYTVEVCANRTVERALQPKPEPTPVPAPPAWGRSRRTEPSVVLPPPTPPAPNPASRLQDLAGEIASAMEFMSARFGPPPLRFLTVSPIPGTFGQGFPGLIYLSTLSYLGREDKPIRSLDPRVQVFFAEILHAHEVAHQWWGNVVSAEGYHDAWLMEALANYSALLYLEKRKGTRVMEAVLEDYRAGLLKKTEGGEAVDSAGPIVLGARLESSLSPDAWRAITYGKGSWILHMLRRRMGDERFLQMMGELRRRYQWKSVTTEEFRGLAAEFLPPKSVDAKLEAFFDQWVYGTGIPAFKLSYAVKGKAPSLRLTGTLTQSEVSEDFAVPVPIEIQFGRGKALTQWVRSAGDPVSFTVALRQAPVKVLLDPRGSVLRR